MAATIRLQRVGRKKQSSFRIVVADVAEARGGPSVETIGIYNPRTRPSVVRLDAAAALRWLHEGAQPSDTVRSILRRTGVWEKFHAGVTAEAIEDPIVAAGPADGFMTTSARAAHAAAAEQQRTWKAEHEEATSGEEAAEPTAEQATEPAAEEAVAAAEAGAAEPAAEQATEPAAEEDVAAAEEDVAEPTAEEQAAEPPPQEMAETEPEAALSSEDETSEATPDETPDGGGQEKEL